MIPAPTSPHDVIISHTNTRRIARCCGEYVGSWDDFISNPTRTILAVIPHEVVDLHIALARREATT